MIHVNAIMISVVVALLARRIHTDHDLLVPTAFLLLVNLAVVLLSVNSMRTARAKLSAEEAHARDSNLMSFFNEKRLSLAEYTDGMSDLVADAPRFQRNVIEHLYFSRKVIQERGTTLRLTYQVFIYGITLAVAGFVIVLARR
jgi:pycsar effector protein